MAMTMKRRSWMSAIAGFFLPIPMGSGRTEAEEKERSRHLMCEQLKKHWAQAKAEIDLITEDMQPGTIIWLNPGEYVESVSE